ncbi:HAMP domain-containing sensor histidine kinase [Clostridium sp. LIBA-8841]|uniref:sensor histidine kinase n=1 Tax=Clostridium sp. LIBA-8841 TaxID=2987530 RepID=UPI002AC7C087|nr:HAMP domain-containing sensor histidine kinase [Clostridium sp. LIBA-8841]MDZ5252931.1 HAMP domain-containing histidine kinase [Clostridium sp. LIBA-8841]
MEYKVEYENPKLQYYILRLIYIIIIISALLFRGTEKYISFYKFLDLATVVMLGTTLLIGISSRINNKNNLIYFVNIGIYWFTIPKFFYLITKAEAYVTDSMVIYKVISVLLQYFVTLVIILGKKKNIDFKKLNIILLISNIVFNIIYVIIANNVKLMRAILKEVNINNFMFIFVVLLFVVLLIMIFMDEGNTSDKFFYYLIGYILLFSVGNIILLNNLDDIKNTSILDVFFSQILDFSAFYILVEGIIRFSLNKNFNDINKIMILKREEYKKNKRYLQKKIDELKELERLLGREERLFNKIVSIIGDYIFIFKEEKLFYLNNEALNFLGISDREFILSESMEVLKKRILKKQVYSKEKSSIDSHKEIIFKNINGGYSNGEVYKIPFGDNYEFIIINDVTKKNNILRINKYLTEKLEEENIKGEFFTNICHELRTPINVINSALQLNNLNIEKQNIESIERNNLVIKQNCLRLIRTINNFIDANKISEGQIEANVMVLNIVDVVENILDASAEYIKKKKINFIFDPDFEEIFVAIDREFLERIILNILSNSVKYGEVNGNIYVKIYFEEKDLVIMIENDGIAISYDEQKYIFDKFTKNNKALNRTQEGSGLGLYISKSLMKMQGGDLRVEIHGDYGNRFKLYFYDVDLFKETERIEHVFNNNYYNLMEKAEIEFSDIYI